METPVNIFELLARVILLAKKYPEAIYQKAEGEYTCRNFIGKVLNGPDEEGCIVGQSLRELGVDETCKLANYGGVTRLVHDRIVTSDLTAEQTLIDIQCYQDNGYTWGRSVKMALGYESAD